MGVRLARSLGSAETLQPGEYTSDPGPRIIGTIVVRCPCCGAIDAFTDRHVVDVAGRVTPAWRCPTATCSFLEWLELESWKEHARS
jgi:hypothetical protein